MNVTVDGVKTFQPLQVPSSDIDNGLYMVRSSIECQQNAIDDQIKYRVWFTTPVRPDRWLFDDCSADC